MKKRRFLSLLLALALTAALVSPAFAAPSRAGAFKNVIFMIGDGMGENHLLLAEAEGRDLYMTANADCRGQSKTRSLSDKVTDSAAGATALSCGVRTTNRYVGTYSIDPSGTIIRPKNVTEVAMAHGMKTGVVTTDSTAGATPAGYSAHVKDRDMAAEITEQQLSSGIDLIWGAAAGQTDRESVEAAGLVYVETRTEMEALEPGSKSFAQFSGSFWRPQLAESDDLPTLAQMTAKAIELLDADNQNGFFLMVEGAHIDKNSHATAEGEDYPDKHTRVVDAVLAFDDAIRTAVEFARADGETLVVVTADHETGDLYMDNGVYTFHSGSHTGANVPLLVFGCTDFVKNGQAVANRTIPARVAEKLGWRGAELPAATLGTFFEKLRKFFSR